MALNIYWTEFAEKELEKIFKYYREEVNFQVAKRIVDSIYDATETLKHQYEIGQKEELLIERNEGFRYLLVKNYKVIYWFNYTKNQIEINDVFDTRQNPIKLKRT